MLNSQAIFFEKFHQVPIVGILRGFDTITCSQVAETFQNAGFTTLEVTMNSPSATDTIKVLVQKFPKLNIGAGTVLNERDVNMALEAGAQFIITPIINKKVIKKCVKLNVPVFPGAYSPSEIFKAWDLGATAVKVFPATQLGTTFIKGILSPLENIKLIPTGGVNKENIKSYFEVGAYGVGMGNSLIDKELIKTENWIALETHFKKIKTISGH